MRQYFIGFLTELYEKTLDGISAFLRVEGVPLDNNLLEENLRKPVVNPKNWLFFKTMDGAMVANTILSLIKTCESNGKNVLNFRAIGNIRSFPHF